MKYLVTMEMAPEQMPRDPEALVRHLEMVVTQHETEAKLEKEGKIVAGGVAAGRTMDVFIADLESNTELNDIMRKLPLAHIMDVQVVPPAGLDDGVASESESIGRIKEALQ
jgi:muconolactone delta-isomerase